MSFLIHPILSEAKLPRVSEINDNYGDAADNEYIDPLQGQLPWGALEGFRRRRPRRWRRRMATHKRIKSDGVT